MNVGHSLEQVAERVHAMEQSKHDYIAPANALTMVGWADQERSTPLFNLGTTKKVKYEASRHAMSMLATHYKIPAAYLELMRQDRPGLMVSNVNSWLEGDKTKRLIRTHHVKDGVNQLRAFLSDRYRPLDNWDLLTTAMPVITKLGLQVRSAELTDTHLYIKATSPKLTTTVKVGDVVEAGIEIRNSEIGMSSVSVSWLIYRLVCANGMRLPGAGTAHYHVGKRQVSDGFNVQALLRDETRMTEDKAFWMKFQDVMRGAFNPDKFEEQVNKLRDAANQKLVGKVEDVVEVTRKRFALSEDLGKEILQNLIKGKDLTRWGLANAVTATANTTKDYDLATQLEGVGGDIIELPRSQWEVIAKAA